MNGRLKYRLRAVSGAVAQLERASEHMGRVGIRNARRSLWARIRALKEECDAQFKLPKKGVPPKQLTWEGKATRMTPAGFNREVATLKPAWWEPLSPDWFDKIAALAANSCAEYGVQAPILDGAKAPALTFQKHELGVMGISFSGFYRYLAVWITRERGRLKVSKKRKLVSGKWVYPLTAAGAIEVNLQIVELLKLNGEIPQ